jgi:hypothetical protein
MDIPTLNPDSFFFVLLNQWLCSVGSSGGETKAFPPNIKK